MRLRVVSPQQSFFDLFEEMTAKVQQGTEELLDLLENYDDVFRKAQRVVDTEHEGTRSPIR
jgi:uncharacterized protein Yka (UPF0111/DUF47 family)